MVTRIRLFFRMLCLVGFIFIIYVLVGKIIDGDMSFKDWLILIISPFLYVLLSVALSLTIQYDSNGISGVLYPILPLKKFKVERQYFEWNEIDSILSQYPWWLPFHIIWIGGDNQGFNQAIMIGSLYTHKARSLLYIADQIDESVLDKNVKKLISIYRRRAGFLQTLKRKFETRNV